MSNLTRENLAWLAGFFDGEGHVSAIRRRDRAADRYAIRLSIDQVSPELLERCAEITGFGKIDRREEAKRRTIHVWRVSTFENVQAFIAMVWPWLSSKRREQGALALERMRQNHATNTMARRSESAVLAQRNRTKKNCLPRGVYPQTRAPHHFQARVARHGKMHHLGTFQTATEAASVRQNWLTTNGFAA